MQMYRHWQDWMRSLNLWLGAFMSFSMGRMAAPPQAIEIAVKLCYNQQEREARREKEQRYGKCKIRKNHRKNEIGKSHS